MPDPNTPNLGPDNNTPAPNSTQQMLDAPPAAPWGGIDDAWNFGEGDKQQPWFEVALPGDEHAQVRELMKTKGYKNPAQVMTAYSNLNKLQNGSPNVIAKPGDDATPEQIAAFHRSLGVPETVDGYKDAIERTEGVEYDDGLVEWSKKAAHKIGITPSQLNQLINDKDVGWNAMMTARNAAEVEQIGQENERALADVAKEWGKDLEPMRAAGKRALDALQLDATTTAALDAAIGSAAMVRMLAALGKATTEGTFKPTTTTGDPNDPRNMTPAVAMERANKLMAEPAYFKADHPEHKATVEKVQALFARGSQAT